MITELHTLEVPKVVRKSFFEKSFRFISWTIFCLTIAAISFYRIDYPVIGKALATTSLTAVAITFFWMGFNKDKIPETIPGLKFKAVAACEALFFVVLPVTSLYVLGIATPWFLAPAIFIVEILLFCAGAFKGSFRK